MNKETVEKIAHLARIHIDDKDMPAITDKLQKVMKLIDEMNAIDTSDIEPMAHPLDLAQRLREDEVTETNQRDEFIKLAPAAEAGLYLVPKVIDIVE
ncbi:MAG: Asp-tRNA(Asn)/Glu-tRNA(Gln) amidotransferase GatCAB subunit C [Legionellaceae bacterium]|nr:Asp-tRNA(Asn)/Glu-tRNA(Gln) amidotransferase GatCAB subunit C [Legionellaceae bacterium]|tara:strand:+ start:23 stop:313 length:291 start_codon:yes stop_codon:yes gene_type:complete